MLPSNQTLYTTIVSPIGELLVAARNNSVSAVYFDRPNPQVLAGWRRDDGSGGAASAALANACTQLAAYFNGELTTFDVTVSVAGTTFQERVWDALRGIEFGQVTSYGELARRIGAPNASRAVGAANGRNPVPIIVPCHRVIGASGSLTGFGGGIERKRWLLDHERGVISAQRHDAHPARRATIDGTSLRPQSPRRSKHGPVETQGPNRS